MLAFIYIFHVLRITTAYIAILSLLPLKIIGEILKVNAIDKQIGK